MNPILAYPIEQELEHFHESNQMTKKIKQDLSKATSFLRMKEKLTTQTKGGKFPKGSVLWYEHEFKEKANARMPIRPE
jgi:hypothetical protein